MTNDEMIAALNQAIALDTQVRDSLAGSAPPQTVVDITPGQSIQSAIDASPAGTTFRIAPGTYEGALGISESAHFIPLNPPAAGQATKDCSVWLTSNAPETINAAGDAISFLGIGIKNSEPTYQLCTVRGSNVTFDRCTALGDPVKGQHRGWQTDGKTVKILACYADNIFLVGKDTAVIGSWQDCNGLVVDGSYLSGGAETIMFGGADSPSADRMPKNIRITNNELTKPQAMFDLGAQVKNAFEVKCVQNLYVGNNIMRFAGTSEGQGAYSIVITVRNQDGTAPWSTIQHVMFENNVCYWAAGAINFLGIDDRPGVASVQMDDVVFSNNRFMTFDGNWGQGRGVMFNKGVRNVTLEALTFENCANMGSLGYFLNSPDQPTGLVLRNWKYATCPSAYGWMIDGGTSVQPPSASNLKALMPDLVYEITASDTGATV